MSLSLIESQAINEMAQCLYSFLPGKPHPYADQSISFLGVAKEVGVPNFWPDGSKTPAIVTLLEKTLDLRRDVFCKLVLEIVRKGLKYRNKRDPITREEIKKLNNLILKVNFKIPELWNESFLNSLPSNQPQPQQDIKPKTTIDLDPLKVNFLSLTKLEPQPRGFAFEKFLNEMFNSFRLHPRTPFRLVGEQIDGSFQLDGFTYLIEAKWQSQPIGAADLYTFKGKLDGKATWSRGLFISYSGFSVDGLEAFSKLGATNMIAMIGREIYYIVEGKMSLIDAINYKARKAAETGSILTMIEETF